MFMTNAKFARIVAILGWGSFSTITTFVTVPVRAAQIAQTVQGSVMTVSPMVTISPIRGSQARASFSVSNPGTTTFRARIYAEDFDYNRNTGFEKIATHSNSARPYLQFSPTEIVVAPGVSRDVRLNIVIPPSKPDGEYRVAIFTEDLTERRIANPNNRLLTIIRPQIGAIFFIIKGEAKPKLSAIATEWNTQTSKPRLVFKNQGTGSAYPLVTWQLKRGDTQVAANAIQGVVLQAQRERAIDIKMPEGTQLSPGEYNLTGEIDNKDGKLVPFSLKLTVPAR